MTMKKLLCCVFALLMMVSLLAGCGSSKKEEHAAPPVVTEAPTEAPTTVPTEPPKVEMATPDLAEYVQKRTVTVNVEMKDGGTSAGSGFFVDDNGTIVTNYHVIDSANAITVEVSDGGKYDVKKIVDFSELYDIAVLQIDISGNDYLEYIEEKCRTGETVYAVGSSLGTLTGTFSDGIISSTSRSVGLIDCVQTTAAISNGNSGGPLVNVYGEVIGINAFSYVGGENLNLAITIDTLDELSMDKNWNLSQYREWYKKEIDRSYLVWNYSTEEYEQSKINTYQHVTGMECLMSSFNWNFLEGDFEDCVDGYDVEYGVFCYEYDVQDFDKYTEYLNSIGYFFVESEDFTDGISYYYQNEFNGYCVDIFVLKGDELVVIEPYAE